MAETLADSGAVKLRAGTNASTLTAAQYTQLINQAEAYASVVCRYDWVTNYSSVPTNMKPILQLVVSSLAAADVIQHDMSGFTSRAEAQTMIDVYYNKAIDAINFLKENYATNFVKTGTTA